MKVQSLSRMYLFLVGCLCLCGIVGCHDKCNPNKDHMKCSDNRLMHCPGKGTDQIFIGWSEVMDCGEYNANCQEVTMAEDVYMDERSFGYHLWSITHGCVPAELSCTADQSKRCAADDGFIAACSLDTPAVPVIISERQTDELVCVETGAGDAAYAVFDGECQDGETRCYGETVIISCAGGLWNGSSADSPCFDEYHYECVDSTNADGLRSASCEMADPCSEETGNYRVCSPESPELYFYCSFSADRQIWRWQLSTCGDKKCVTASDGTGSCQ
ncbi:MAG: hypothetical protein JXX14_01010 [Deltaproteobacteria bacterium]|nr:hypothetical protein [Deltaproteobacteria bacterium]